VLDFVDETLEAVLQAVSIFIDLHRGQLQFCEGVNVVARQ
jgi:hypothetical protein